MKLGPALAGLDVNVSIVGVRQYMSHSLNSLKEGYIGDYIGDYYKAS